MGNSCTKISRVDDVSETNSENLAPPTSSSSAAGHANSFYPPRKSAEQLQREARLEALKAQNKVNILCMLAGSAH